MPPRPPQGGRQRASMEVFWSKQAWVSRASSRGRDRIKRPNQGDRKVPQKYPKRAVRNQIQALEAVCNHQDALAKAVSANDQLPSSVVRQAD
jgi:hypothetical protein